MVNHLLTRLTFAVIATTRSLLIGLALLLSACADPGPAVIPTDIDTANIKASLAALTALRIERHQRLILDAESLRRSIDELLLVPDSQHQQTAQAAWRNAHLAFIGLATLPFAKPLIEPLVDSLAPLLYQIDAWPIEPGYLDTLPAYPDSGLISDLTVTITPESLREQNGFTDSSEVSLGFHALEYLIFDRDSADFLVSTLASPRVETTADAQTNANEIIVRRRLVLDMITTQITLDLDHWPTESTESAVDEAGIILTSEVDRLLAASLQTARLAITEANRLLIPGEGHGIYSHSTGAALKGKVNGLNQIFFAPINLGKVLSPLAADAVAELEKTLREAADLCDLAAISEVQETRLGLVLLTLPDQIEALSAVMTKAMADAQVKS